MYCKSLFIIYVCIYVHIRRATNTDGMKYGNMDGFQDDDVETASAGTFVRFA